MTTTFFWFHSFHRTSVEELIQVLRVGPTPPLATLATTTQQLELHLSIAPARVYCFLGRTAEAFGDCAFAFRAESLPGAEVSPFDTGGLVKHIVPIRGWSRERQQEYLESYTWDSSQMEGLLALYPGSDRESAERYLDVTRSPAVAGPHSFWSEKISADIWNSNQDWRCWTWEGRWAGRLSVGHRLMAWTCSPSVFPQILEYADRAATVEEQTWFGDILGKRIDGGVGSLVAALRRRQVPT